MLNISRISSCQILAVALFTLAGCSGEPRLYSVKGKVTYKDEPVPAGLIYFDPTAGKNTGPQGYAVIKDGFYDTSAPQGRGVTGGDYTIRIHGADGVPKNEQPLGTPLFEEYTTQVDLPKSNSEQNFEVPVQKK